jgi:tetratricopeptide (TPR) repeat protein
MDSYLGISKGDITLSLLNEDNSISAKSTWANRVRVAVWRARRMRRGFGGNSHVQDDRAPGTPVKRGSSLHGDIDRARVSGSVRTVQGLQEAALVHLMHDEVDEALELFEDIIFAYYNYFERSLKAREDNPGVHHASTDFRPYIGAALHNLGILNLLKGEYNQALSYFGRAVDNRRGCLGESHRDHVVSV